MMKSFFFLFLFLLAVGSGALEIDFFSKEYCAWANAAKVKDRKQHGFVYGNPGEMWFKATESGESLKWSSKPIPVTGGDQIILEYRLSGGALLTVDIKWDGGKLERPLGKAPGNGDWQKLVLPVKGKNLTLIPGLNSGDTPGICKIDLKPLQVIEYQGVQINEQWLAEPIIIPIPKKMVKSGGVCAFNRPGIRFADSIQRIGEIIAAELAGEIGMPLSANKELAECDVIIELKIDERLGGAEKYRITFEPGRISLTGADRAGLYWAWQSLRQLRQGKSFSAYDIEDWPDLNYRSLTASDMDMMLNEFRMKSNKSFYPWWGIRDLWNFNAASPKEKEKFDMLRNMCVAALERGSDITLNFAAFSAKPVITVSDDAEIEKLFKLYDQFMSLGCRLVYAWIDDGGRSSLSQADKTAYGDDKLSAHAWFVKKLSERIWKTYPDAMVGTCTLEYWGTHGIEGYFDRIGVSPNVFTIWTGTQVVTADYRKNDINAYEKGIGGRNYVIHENIGTQAHGMYRSLVAGETYAAGYGPLADSSKFGGMLALIYPSNQMRTIKCWQMADYYWNAHNYDAEKSRQRAIAKVAGSAAAVEPMIRFSEEYLKIAYKYPVDKGLPGKKSKDPSYRSNGSQDPVIGRSVLAEKEVARYSIGEADYQAVLQQLAALEKRLQTLTENCPNKILAEEAGIMADNARAIIEYLYRNQVEEPRFDHKLVFDINRIPGGTHYRNHGNGKIGCALYGQLTPYKELEIHFIMPKPEELQLFIEGQNCDKNRAAVKFEINGHEVFSGPGPFGDYPEWREVRYSIPAGCLKEGRNTLKIINLSPYSDFIDHWIIVSGLRLARP